MTIQEATEAFRTNERSWSVWFYAVMFFVPAVFTIVLMTYVFELDMLFSGIVGLAVMNGSINSVIAYITIRLDDKSSESLQHLEFLNNEMGKLEETLEEANSKVQGFTADLDEAKDIFRQVGVDLTDIDLEPVADIVDKLKENGDGLSEVLEHLKEVDVTEYISQAKRIDWKQLLGAAEEVMGFIQQRSAVADSPMKSFKPTLLAHVPDDEEVDADPEWVQLSNPQWVAEPEPWPAPKPAPNLNREPVRRSLSLDRKKPKGPLTLKR